MAKKKTTGDAKVKPGDGGPGLTANEVQKFLELSLQEYENGDEKFFDRFTEDATIFTVSSPTRIDGREVFRRGFEPFFLGTKRQSQILSPEVRLLGPRTAMMSFH